MTPIRSGAEAAQDQPPVLAVVKGNPTPEEIAALVVVLSSRAPAAEPAHRSEVSGWSAYARTIRAPLQPGPGAWRMSSRG